MRIKVLENLGIELRIGLLGISADQKLQDQLQGMTSQVLNCQTGLHSFNQEAVFVGDVLA